MTVRGIDLFITGFIPGILTFALGLVMMFSPSRHVSLWFMAMAATSIILMISGYIFIIRDLWGMETILRHSAFRDSGKERVNGHWRRKVT